MKAIVKNKPQGKFIPMILVFIVGLAALGQASAKDIKKQSPRVNSESLYKNSFVVPTENSSPMFKDLSLLDKNGLPAHRCEGYSKSSPEFNGKNCKTYRHRNLRFDIAENGSRFSFDSEPVDENGLPAYGGEFITEGYLYPFGFLENHEGVNEDGSPAYPEQVLGRWVCRGWHVGNGATTVTGPWVVTTQIFDLDETFGQRTIITEGYELADINKPISRAITGGTGRFSRARGSSNQKLLGFNQSYGVNVRVVLHPRN